jgi:hypothetical protein
LKINVESKKDIGWRFDTYVTTIAENWNKEMISKQYDPKTKAEIFPSKIYTLKDIIKSEWDMVEHFVNFLQTGKMPDWYDDKEQYERMKGIGKVKELPKDWGGTGTPPVWVENNNTVVGDGKATTPEKVGAKAREVEAGKFADKNKWVVKVSWLWTDSVYVEYPSKSKKWDSIIKMFKSPGAKKIGNTGK